MENLNEYDQRQIFRMRRLLEGFDDGAVSFHDLVSSISFLISVLESDDTVFIEALRSQWGVLEEVRAVAMDEGRKELDELDEKLVRDAVGELRRLTEGIASDKDREA